MNGHSIIRVREGDKIWSRMKIEFPDYFDYMNDPNDDGTYYFFCATGENEEYLGGAVIDIGIEDEGPLAGETIGFLEEIEVNSERRRHGIGKALLKAVLDEAWSQNAQHVRWRTGYEDLEAVAFYKALGFALCTEGTDDGKTREQFTGVAQNPNRVVIR